MKFLIFFLFTVSTSAFGAQMPEKWHTLWKLIDEEAKTIEGLGRLSPRMSHRLLELYSEKIKLVRERENKLFFAASAKERHTLGRAAFFKESAALHKKIQSLGLKLLKQFPQYQGKAEVWYTLGLNERDYNNDKFSERYLLQALQHAGGRQALRHNAMTSLAEYYYNGKKYQKCLKYYQPVINNANDEWRTKHLYNMSWCYVKTNNYAEAINKLRLTYDLILESSLEKNPHPVRYTDIGSQVLEAIGVFHILDKRPLEARDFFMEKIRDSKEKAETLSSFARKIADKGFFPEAQEVTLNALEIAREAKHLRLIAEIHLFQLDFYRNFKREDLLFKTAQDLLSFHQINPLTDQERDQAVDRLQAFAGWLQERLAKTLYEGDDNDKVERILAYFDILIGINPLRTAWYHYYQGETLYITKQDARSAKVYRLSFDLLKENTSKEKEIDELRRKNMNALLSILSRAQIRGKELHELTEYTYTQHLQTWPVDETSRSIYGRLFTLYLDHGERAKADAVLTQYVTNYQQDLTIQQDMMASLMDDQIKKKDAPDLSASIKRLEKGYLNFDKDKINKAVSILGQLLFEETDHLRRQGKPQESLAGLSQLAAAETYPLTIRRQAAFTHAVVALELGNGPIAFEWLGKAIVLMDAEVKENKQEVKDPFGQALTQMDAMANELLLTQDFSTARNMSEAILQKMCRDQRKEKKMMKSLASRAFNIRLLEEQKTDELIKLISRCQLDEKFVTDLIVQGYRHHLSQGNLDEALSYWQQHHKILGEMSGEKELLVDLSKRRFWQDIDAGLPQKVLKALGEKAWLEQMKNSIKEINRMSQTRFSLPLMTPFDQDIYNPALEKMLAQIQELATRIEPYLQGESEIVLRAVYGMNQVYAHAAQVIENYIPQEAPEDFVAQFQSFMKQISSPMRAKAKQQSKQIERLVQKDKLQSPNSMSASVHGHVYEQLGWRHPAAVLAMPMTVPAKVPSRMAASHTGATND